VKEYREYLVFVVTRTVRLELLVDEPMKLKHPYLMCVYSGRCTEEYARKLAAKYKEAYYVEASKRESAK